MKFALINLLFLIILLISFVESPINSFTTSGIENKTTDINSKGFSIHPQIQSKLLFSSPAVTTSLDNVSAISEDNNITIYWKNFTSAYVNIGFNYSISIGGGLINKNVDIAKNILDNFSFTWMIELNIINPTDLSFFVVSSDNSSQIAFTKTFYAYLNLHVILSYSNESISTGNQFAVDDPFYLLIHGFSNVYYTHYLTISLIQGNDKIVLKKMTVLYGSDPDGWYSFNFPWNAMSGINYQIQVEDDNSYTPTDIYTNYFEIIDKSSNITLTSMNGTNVTNITEGNNLTITWDPFSFSDKQVKFISVNLSYSQIDSIVLVQNMTNSGKLIWNSLVNLMDYTPNSLNAQKLDNNSYRILITNLKNSTDQINSNKFRIAFIPRVFLVESGRFFPYLEMHKINSVPYYTYSFFLFQGSTLITNLEQNISLNNNYNHQFYPYTLAGFNYLPGGTYRFVFQYGPSWYFSDNFTTSLQPAFLNIKSSETIYYGSTFNVTWINENSSIINLSLLGHIKNVYYGSSEYYIYSKQFNNNGTILLKIDFNLPQSSLELLNTQYDYYYFKITGENGSVGISEKFSLVYYPQPIPITFSILSPDGFFTWYKNYSYEIAWNGISLNQMVSIDLYKNNSFYKSIVKNLKNENYYVWRIDQTIDEGNDYVLKILINGQENYSFEYSNTFAIASIEDKPIYVTFNKTASTSGFQLEFVIFSITALIYVKKKVYRGRNKKG